MKLFVFFSLLSACMGSVKWDTLKVTWGMDSTKFFNKLPRTAWDAVNDGFIKISDCSRTASWRGAQYIKNNDYALVLLYDVNGYIAGIQTTVPKNQNPEYPKACLQPPYIENGDRWYITAYFIDPAKICTTGRSQEDFEKEGTATNLYLQNSTSPEASFTVPLLESDQPASQWTKGRCFPSMGVHYWWNLSEDSDCGCTFPVFLLYNEKKLTAFGFAKLTKLTSPRYEYPPPGIFPKFMEIVPTCLTTDPTASTMHIYGTDSRDC